MVLLIDIGNSVTTIGLSKDEEILFSEKITTSLTATDLEYAISIKTILKLHDIKECDIKGGIISSVVPSVTDTVKSAAYKVTDKKFKVVGPGLKTGLKISIENPAQLGSDLAVNGVSAINNYEAPLIIIDFGTATTFSLIDCDKSYVGGIIMPGILVSLDNMINKTSKLPKIALEMPKDFIGKNTVDCMKSGITYGTAKAVDGIVSKIKNDYNIEPTIIATGENAKIIIELCKNKIIYDKNLLLKGLNIIYNKNTK